MKDPVPARGSLRSRGAALVSTLTLRQISAVLPPEQAGGAEMLLADARRLAADIRAGGGNCRLEVWPDQVHVFQALPRLAPEAAKAMARAAGFIRTSLRASGFDAVAGKAG
jgi:acetyl esterase/lipase